MFNIRKNMFETNSSSLHSFILPKNSSTLKIPKTVKIYGSGDPTTSEGRIQFMYSLAHEYGFGEDFKLYLKSKGIVIADDPEPKCDILNMLNCYELTEHELEQILFNPDIISEYDINFDKLYKNDNYIRIDIRE